jgi:hypothetical protein
MLFFDSCKVKTIRVTKMVRYTLQQRIEIVKIHYRYGENLAETVRRVRGVFGRNEAPSRTAIVKLIKKFEEIGQVSEVKSPVRRRRVRSAENIAAVAESVAENPRMSIPRRSQQLHITQTSLHRILHKDLHLHAYKVQLVQELKPRDHEQRRTFVQWALRMQENIPQFLSKIILSDEAHFHLSGFVNKQNCRIWGSENPRIIVEKPLYPQRVTVWCGFWAGGVIGPYFFENNEGETVTVNAQRYRTMLTDFLWPILDEMDVGDVYFQQDGATSHTSGETIALLRQRFPGRVISRRGDINWPPRSCDLTPLDFFLWGYVKDKVYANNPPTIEVLKDNIRAVIREIEQPMCGRVMQHFFQRMEICNRSRGGHLSDIVFHK